MESYLLLLDAPRAATSRSSPAPPEYSHKLSARQSHRHRRTQRHVMASTETTSAIVSPRAPLSPSSALSTPSDRKQRHAHDAFRSVEVLGEVVRLEADASRATLQPEDAFALLRRLVTPQHVARVASTLTDSRALSLDELLGGIDAACWRTLAPTSVRVAAGESVRVRFAQLYRGVHAAIEARRATCATLETTLAKTVQRADALPAAVSAREAAIEQRKASLVARSARALDCDVLDSHGVAAAVDAKVQTLRRRRDLRAWACSDLRDAITDDVTRTSELKKQIAVIAADVKKEELAHRVKAQRVEAAVATTLRDGASSSVSGRGSGDIAIAMQQSLEARVAQAQAKNAQLLDAIAKRKAQVRARTESVFATRSAVAALASQLAVVEEQIDLLQHDIAHVERSCTPRPDWSQLLDAAVVTTAIDRVNEAAKRRIEQSRTRVSSTDKVDDDGSSSSEHQQQLHTMLRTSHASTIDKVRAMAAELTRIRTTYHAGDALGLEQAKLEHLQNEIARTLQQLDAIRSADAAE